MKFIYISLLATCMLPGMQSSKNPALPALIETVRAGGPIGLFADLRVKDYWNRTLHMHAIMVDNTPALDVLLGQTSYPEYATMIDENGWTLLHYAAFFGNTRAVIFLMHVKSQGYEIHHNTENIRGMKPIDLAKQAKHTKIVRLLAMLNA